MRDRGLSGGGGGAGDGDAFDPLSKSKARRTASRGVNTLTGLEQVNLDIAEDVLNHRLPLEYAGAACRAYGNVIHSYGYRQRFGDKMPDGSKDGDVGQDEGKGS